MSGLFYTLTRNVPADADQKPNGFLFVSQELPSTETMYEIFKHPQLRAMLPEGKPVFCIRYYKEPIAIPGFLPEWRIVLTTLPYYSLPLNDERDQVSVFWEDESGKENFVNYRTLLINCTSPYRFHKDCGKADRSYRCPYMGLECVKQNFGHRPWFMLFSYNRKDEWSVGLADTGELEGRLAKNTEHEFRGQDYKSILKQCMQLRPAGATFRKPNDTRPNATPRMGHPLRPPRDHRFFSIATTAPATPAAPAESE